MLIVPIQKIPNALSVRWSNPIGGWKMKPKGDIQALLKDLQNEISTDRQEQFAIIFQEDGGSLNIFGRVHFTTDQQVF